MSRGVLYQAKEIARFPRVSGDEPLTAIAVASQEVFSPRERG